MKNATADNIISALRTDCIHYRGDRPCLPHIQHGHTCSCEQYLPIERHGVIIKLGAAGDVLRTTPLLRAIKNSTASTRVLFVTHFPDCIPSDAAEAIRPDALTFERLKSKKWDFCWNLDKDIEACLLNEVVHSDHKRGFGLKNGVPYPIDEAAWHKFATGVDNIYSRSNTIHYIQEIFDIVGLPYRGEEYWITEPTQLQKEEAARFLPGENWIGLNTGAGARWPTRLWSEDHWIALIKLLKARNLKPLLLGGPEERERNERLAQAGDTLSSGVVNLGLFHAMIQRCACVVSSVTQAMHLAIASKRPLILLNNIFNRHEFELFGRGQIIEPHTECQCYYAPKCKVNRNCINEIEAATVLEAIVAQVDASR